MSFSFTKKKFIALKKITRHKWVIKWLSDIYQKLITNRIEPENITLFASDYKNVMQWMNTECKNTPDADDIRAWVEFVSDEIHSHRVSAGISPKDHDLLNSPLSLIKTGDGSSKKKLIDYHIAVDSLRSLFNVGALFRTCDAAGFSSIILGNTPGPENSSVQKTSMGASKWVKSYKTEDLASELIKKQDKGYLIIGIETIQGSVTCTDFNWPEKAVLVTGNEEYGISRHVLRICDSFVHIPMYGKKNSINVVSAASIVMFQVAEKLNSNQ